MRRPAAVAGTFYPADPETLRSELERYLQSEQPPQPALACVVPHAGIMYSGSVAGAVYARLALPSTAIILAPNHRRWGAPLAVMTEGEWETPLGAVPIATGLARALRQACPALVEDAEAHRFEHSLEVQLPFLQRRRRDLHFVPVGVGEDDYGALEALGRGVATVVREADPKPLIVASTDLNHYDPDPINRVKDRKVIEPILALDPR
ncbi:MAG: AmmeMemoRadiSam system protein B, partial [Terriglobia bacterium]